MTQTYLKFPEWFVIMYQMYYAPPNMFYAVQDINGNWVSGIGAYTEFPLIMSELENIGWAYSYPGTQPWVYENEQLELGIDDFPPPIDPLMSEEEI